MGLSNDYSMKACRNCNDEILKINIVLDEKKKPIFAWCHVSEFGPVTQSFKTGCIKPEPEEEGEVNGYDIKRTKEDS